MSAELPEYAVGSQGVNIVATPLHTPTGGLLIGENLEFIRIQGIGGIGLRRGLAPLNASALSGTVKALANVPLSYPGTITMILALNKGDTTNSWKSTVDGTTFANILLTALPRAAQIDKAPTALVPINQRPASFKRKIYFPGDAYTQNTDAPPIIVYDGTIAYTQITVPTSATASGVSRWITDMIVADNVIYFGVYDPGGTGAPNVKGRVFSYDPAIGLLEQIGNGFGSDADENAKGMPFCLCMAFGYLWAGTYGISGNAQGNLWRIQPIVDTGWTLDHTATLHNGYYMSVCQYKGKLYAATDADVSGTPIVEVRDGTGAWTTSFTAPTAGVGYIGALFVFNDLLFCVFYNSGGGGTCLVKMFDGTTWTTDLDVGATYAVKPPGMPFLYQGAMYWPFLGSDSSNVSTAGFLLKRTTAGAWTRPLNTQALRGCLGQVVI